jgi:endoglucanase
MLIERLTNANGLPLWEDEVRDIIRDEIKDYADKIHIDRLGNLIAVKNENAAGKHIALSAHMDEAGIVIKHIEKNGMLKFASWGVDPRVLVSKVVKIGKNRLNGVIGSKPRHLQELEERNVALTLGQLYIDIGVDSGEEAEKLVSIGDYAAFDSELREFGDNKLKGKAFDDRVGCAAIIELLKSELPYKLTAVFTAQEEVGLRGAAAAANQVEADIVISLEASICADTPGVEDQSRATILGGGPAISMMDAGSIFIKKYIELAVDVAKANNIPFQFRGTAKGGTDAARFHTARGGTPVIGLEVPCRYIHSPVSVIDKSDYENFLLLIKKIIIRLNEEDN